MKILGTPIDGVNDWISEVAMLFASECSDEARALATIGTKEAEKAALEAEIVAKGKERTSLERARKVPRKRKSSRRLPNTTGSGLPSRLEWECWQGSRLFPWALARWQVRKPPWGWALCCSSCTEESFSGKRGSGIPFSLSFKARLSDIQSRLSGIDSALSEAKKKIETLTSEIAELQPSRGVEAVGRVYFPMLSTEIAGYPVLIDEAGLETPSELQIADLISDPVKIKEVSNAVEKASSKPKLLEARNDCGQEVDSLQGEEADLRSAVETFTDMVETIPQVSASVRLVRSDRGVAAEIAEQADHLHESDVPGLVLEAGDSEQTNRSVQELSDITRKMRTVGMNAGRCCPRPTRDFRGFWTIIKRLRADAIERMHDSFLEVVGKSEMPQITYYCPKCNRLPMYLFQKLGFALEEAHLLDQRALFRTLMGDSEIAERLSADETILHEMDNSFQKYSAVKSTMERIEGQLLSSSAAVGADMADMQQGGRRLKGLQSQVTELLKNYRGWVRKAVTGSERPLLEISTQARLFLDPVHDTWTCKACDTVFDDPGYYEMGRMMKVQEHLMMPMWNHLWTEKDDFRKAELFRTNEALQRMGEKESEKLINIADQYRSDMRPVRENLIRSAADTENKTTQLFDTIDGLAAIGLLTPEDGDRARREIEEQLGGDVLNAKHAAERKELVLSQEPAAQIQTALGERPHRLFQNSRPAVPGNSARQCLSPATSTRRGRPGGGGSPSAGWRGSPWVVKRFWRA